MMDLSALLKFLVSGVHSRWEHLKNYCSCSLHCSWPSVHFRTAGYYTVYPHLLLLWIMLWWTVFLDNTCCHGNPKRKCNFLTSVPDKARFLLGVYPYIILFRMVLYRVVLYLVILYCTLPHRIILYSFVSYVLSSNILNVC